MGLHAVASKCGDAAIWTMENPGKAGIIVVAAFAVLLFVGPVIAPSTVAVADDGPQLFIDSLLGIGGSALGDLALDAAADQVEDLLRSCDRLIYGATEMMLINTASATTLTATFDSLLGSASASVGSVGDLPVSLPITAMLLLIHHNFVIPLANMVLVVFLTFGLLRIVGKAGQTDGGIDTWQLIWLFVMYGLAKMFVDGSWELMTALFNIMNNFIADLIQGGTTVISLTDPTEGVEDVGALLALLLMLVIGFIISCVVCALSHIVVIVRAIQIYIYTVVSPIPFAFAVSEGGREMTKSFLKRYFALLLTGAILALLFFMLSTVVGAIHWPTVEIHNVADFAEWWAQFLINLAIYLAFAWAVFKSGSWANELVGV